MKNRPDVMIAGTRAVRTKGWWLHLYTPMNDGMIEKLQSNQGRPF
jgi:hypothetical protein